MDPADLDAGATAHVHGVLCDVGLDASYLAFVARHLTVPDAEWRWCCGSQCDPCVQRLGLAVDRVRAGLGISPPGLPLPGESA